MPSGQQIRECLVAIGFCGLLAAAVTVWQRQSAIDLPPRDQARSLEAEAPVHGESPASRGSASSRAMPAGSPGSWLRDMDYPVEAQRKQWEGVTGLRLDIDTAGRVERCMVTAPSGHAILDETSCRLLVRRARFMPARDASGVPMPGSFSTRVTWRLPD